MIVSHSEFFPGFAADHINRSLLSFAAMGNFQLPHPTPQGARMQAKQFCSPLFPFHFPTGLIQGPPDMSCHFLFQGPDNYVWFCNRFAFSSHLRSDKRFKIKRVLAP